MTFYCTAPVVWPPIKPVAEMEPQDVGGATCWSEFASPAARRAHALEAHPEWCEAMDIGPLDEVATEHRAMGCYGCSTMQPCLPTELKDTTWAWVCDGCRDRLT